MFLALVIVIGFIILDQITKLLADSLLVLGQTNIIIPHILEFKLYYNTGASFGILEGNQLLFMAITLVALAIGGYFFKSVDLKSKKVYSFAIIFFIAGTLGNAIDRIRIGKVIDFLYMPVISYTTSLSFIFNIADVLLNAAVVLFVIDILFLEKRRTKDDTSNESSQAGQT